MGRLDHVHIRVPDRAVSTLYSNSPDVNGLTTLTVNGAPMQPTIENGYAVISREWKTGDKVGLELPMQPYRVKAIDKVKADHGRVALMYGPLVFNIESVDQDVNKVLAPDAPLSTELKPDLLGGTIVIKSKFTDGSDLLAIPNYLRENRGGRVGIVVGGKTAEKLLAKVKPGGVFASVLGAPQNAEKYPSIKVVPVHATPDTKILRFMAEAVRDGKLVIPISEKLPLSDAAEGQAAAEKGGIGKVLLVA